MYDYIYSDLFVKIFIKKYKHNDKYAIGANNKILPKIIDDKIESQNPEHIGQDINLVKKLLYTVFMCAM
jgi:hypothetical protein